MAVDDSSRAPLEEMVNEIDLSRIDLDLLVLFDTMARIADELVRYNWPRTASITVQSAVTVMMMRHAL